MLSASNKLLEHGFNILNKIYYDNTLPKTIITIQSNPKSYGYITVQKVWHNGEDNYYEINISAEHLARPIENVLATLNHEMVHLYCMVNNIQDVSGGRYHNKKFREQGEKRDLIIEYVKYIGYSKTSPSEKFIKVLKENGLYTNIDYCRAIGNSSLIVPPTGGDSDNSSNIKKKSSTRKYRCESCLCSVRATRNVNIICADCMALMVKVE